MELLRSLTGSLSFSGEGVSALGNNIYIYILPVINGMVFCNQFKLTALFFFKLVLDFLKRVNIVERVIVTLKQHYVVIK